MKKLFMIGMLSMLVLQMSCKEKQEGDVYLYLTQEQKDFITTVRAGDTAIWESDGGIKDTAIVQPLVYRRYLMENHKDTNPKVYAEEASYTYKIVGTNKLRPLGSMSVFTSESDNSLLTTARYGNIATGVFPNKKFGGVDYTNVYWFLSATVTDTIFWSSQGFLGYDYAGVRVEKIK